MKKLNQKKWLTILILFGGILFSCNNDEPFDDVNSTVMNNEFTVNKTLAENIATNLLLVNTKENLSNKSLKNATIKKRKKIRSILEVPDKNKKTAYFIINYKEGGFIILAGDKRSEPILAFSEINQFDVESDYFPTGLVSWLYSSKENIEKIREKNEKISPQTGKQWENLQKGGADVISYRIEPEESDCTPYTIQKGPFVQTTWGKGAVIIPKHPQCRVDHVIMPGLVVLLPLWLK